MYKMVVTDNCPRCSSSKSILENKGLLDQVELVNIRTEEGMQLAKQYGLTMAGADIIDISNSTKMSVADFVESRLSDAKTQC